jgi:hypothetical protein
MNTWPVTRAASGDARKATSGATFSGAQVSKPSSAFCPKISGIDVSVMTVRARGAIAFAVMPYFTMAFAVDVVSAMMPAFAAA